MQEIFNFIKANWELIAAVVTLIVSVVIAAFRKKPINSIVTAIYCAAVQAINIAESTGKKGREKLLYCVGLVEKSLEVSYPSLNASSYYGFIVKIIEEILTTPQKKGE